MENNVIQMAGWKRRVQVFPVAAYNAWIDYWSAIFKAWNDLTFPPKR